MMRAALISLLAGFAFTLPLPGLAQPKEAAVEEVTVDRETADLIRGGLKYLAAQQKPNGGWSEGNHEAWETAITGYALMAFLATGNLPNEGEHAKTVAAGAQFLLDTLQSDGKFTSARRSGQYMYGHGIATIVLAELYGQTKSAAMRPKLEAAIKLIIDSQNAEGGWRYHPVPRDADVSVTVLQAVALRAAKNSGLDVPQTALDKAVKYIHSCYDTGSGGFTYQPRNKGPGYARTAAAIYSLQVLGRYDDPKVVTGTAYITKRQNEPDGHYTYGNFYAGPAQYMVGGASWKKYYNEIKTKLLRQVRRQGEMCLWDAQGRDPGPIYATAVFTTILSLPYQYVPLYQR